MNDITHFILMGIYYGYPVDAIHAYLMRRCDLEMGGLTEESPTSIGTQFALTGLIPSRRQLGMTLEEVTSEVNSRRICSQPFPHDGPEDGFDAFLDNPPEDIEDRMTEVLVYLKENTYESYLRANAERRSGSQLPAGRLDETPPGPGVSRH
jgi:hypothetical protein